MALTPNRARVLRAAAALAIGTSIFVGSAAGTALAAAPAAVEQSTFDRSLHLDGAKNARDVGGYTTVDGRTVKTGLVFRTDALNKLSPADLARLEGRNVKAVDDLRTVYERALQPDLVPAGAKANWYDVLGASPVTTLVDLNSAYRAFITGPGANQAFAAVLRDIRDTDGAVLFHCSAGKDRTGWTAAVLLTILGVDRATVNADFMLSNVYRGVDATSPTAMLDGVKQEWLDSAFATADERYGSFDNYVHQGLGLTDADIAALKAKLLA
ncbi:tyrosine-protein phosphatase [Rhodococcus sp. PvR099]|uniref:tyrosine-protein phosphatase n=1 Tax=Rhodococcus sp. PvR099 TaxID=2806602 RepID=UPI001AE95A8E|nr:tyrosine-protein phosphatase [Rhodococcus sp. PvR099]MBP1158307.1 protein-tyrosine phosphatase [Rhodococcus sp. PvR099]